ncbi:MAG: DUF4389 domain-containing protein [Candidatus Zixiibacteriota bacterium]
MYDYPVKYSVDYPEKSSRLLVVARFLLGWLYIGIPHGIFAIAYSFLSLFVVIFCYFAILIKGTFPLRLFDFLIRYNRYLNRVIVYCLSMTDKYPPFSGRR